ncbi:DNA polymerase III subunit beta [Microtetraspora malaysiensis]|uniref:DNA polymerase III subunit beta n=1 Tax=Microtetraspora malaysiensis TaxID=161358 RepID=A0ABW6SKC1_9ACTN
MSGTTTSKTKTRRASAKADGGTKPPAKRRTKKDEPTPEPKVETAAAPEPEQQPETTAEPEATAGQETEETALEETALRRLRRQVAAQPEPEQEPEQEQEQAPEQESEPEADPQPKAEPEPEQAPEPEPDPEPESEPDVDLEAEPEAGPQPEPLVKGIPASAPAIHMFDVGRDLFAQAVAWTAQYLPQRPSVPVLAGMRLDLADGQLRLSAYDYEVSAEATIPVGTGDTASLLVPGKLLAEITRSLPTGFPVEVTVNGTKFTVECGPARFTLLTMPVEDYPTLPGMPPTSGRVDGAAFAAVVAQAAVAAGKDETLPMLTAVRMEIEGGTVTLAATDRYRLAVGELAWEPEAPGVTAAVMVPARVLAAAAKTFTGVGEVEIALPDQDGPHAGLFGLSGGGRRITTRLLDPEFPNYRSLIPTAFERRADLPTSQLIDAVKRVALVADRETPVLLQFTEGQVTVEAGTGDEAQGIEKLPAEWTGEPLTIAFNHQYLLEGLGAAGTPKVRLNMSTPVKPAVLTGIGVTGEEMPGYQYLIMPVRLSG